MSLLKDLIIWLPPMPSHFTLSSLQPQRIDSLDSYSMTVKSIDRRTGFFADPVSSQIWLLHQCSPAIPDHRFR